MRTLRASKLAAAATLVAGCLSIAAATGVGASTGTLVFATGADGRSDRLEIAAVAADGHGFRKLTHVAASGTAPRWSSDGRRILFITEDSFTLYGANWMVRGDGSGLRRLPGFQWDVPSASGRLVFAYDRIIGVNGKVVRRLRPGLGRNEYYDDVLWAPNGRYVVLNGLKEREESDFYDYRWVHLVPTTPGGRARALTSRKKGRFAEALSWSPDSRRLFVGASRGRGADFYTVGPDGSSRRLLFHVRGDLSGHHAWSPDSSSIAYLGRRGGIFVIDANGGRPRRVAPTRNRGRYIWDVDLDWSTRGEIAFSDKGGIYVMHSDGTGLHRLSRRTGRPRWSPDGLRLVLSQGKEVYMLDRRGHERQLTRWLSDGDPDVSPDGRRIAFVHGDGVNLEAPSVYVVNADGSDRHRLGRGARPRWSPDGTRVAYVRDRPMPQDGRIVVAAASGVGAPAVIDGNSPAWSRDGRLAFMRYSYVHEDRGDHGGAQWYVVNSTLLTAPADGGVERRIAEFDARSDDGPTRAWGPTWSPDGKTLALLFGGSVVLVDADNGTRRMLDLRISPSALEWAPAGGQILAREYDRISVIDTATGSATTILELTDKTVEDATWSPDGSMIGFVRCTSDGGDCDVFSVAAEAGATPARRTKTLGIESGLAWAP